MVVVAVDADEPRAVDEGIENLGWFQVGRHQNASLEAEARGLRGDRVGEVAGGGTADDVEPEGAGVGERHGDDSVFKREGREADGVVFDVKVFAANALAEIFSADEGG